MKEPHPFRHVSVVNGPGAHGKDQFIAYVLEVAASLGIAGHNFSSIDPCRLWSQRRYGFEPTDKSDEARRALIALKRDWERRVPQGPNRYLLRQVMQVESGFVFLHVRELPNILTLQRMGKRQGVAIETVHVLRPGHTIPDNPSDRGTLGPPDNQFPYDLFIENAGSLDDLRQIAARYVADRIPSVARL